jgi:hypothetical protein
MPLRSDLPAAAVTCRICSGEVELRTAFAQSGTGDEDHVASTNVRMSVDGRVDVRAG